jgi:putative chitinase
MLTVQALLACGVQPSVAKDWIEPLKAALAMYAIDTKVRIAAFLAQAVHESAHLTRIEENLYYTTPERIRAVFPSYVPSLAEAARLTRNGRALANRVYANRLGNGDESSDDGWRYRGSGVFQLTGRSNFAASAMAIGRDYKLHPEWVRENKADAALTAAHYFRVRGGVALADSSQIDAISQMVAGSRIAVAERRSLFDHALAAMA